MHMRWKSIIDKCLQDGLILSNIWLLMKNKMLIVCAHVKSPQLCSTLCDPMDCSPPGSSVHGILQARILEWVTMPSSGSSDPGIKPTSLMFPVLAVGFFTTSTTWEARILLRPEEPGGLQPIGQQRVRHDWSNLAHTHISQNKNQQSNTSKVFTLPTFPCTTTWVYVYSQSLSDI